MNPIASHKTNLLSLRSALALTVAIFLCPSPVKAQRFISDYGLLENFEAPHALSMGNRSGSTINASGFLASDAAFVADGLNGGDGSHFDDAGEEINDISPTNGKDFPCP